MKTQGLSAPLISSKDLDTMFQMFDITNKGAVTVAQATEALRTILGPQAELEDPYNAEPQRLLTKPQFIEVRIVSLGLWLLIETPHENAVYIGCFFY